MPPLVFLRWFGISPATFGARLEYVATIGIACEMLMWGRRISAQRAYEIGFVNKVVPKGKVMDEAMEWAEYMCTLGLPSVMAHKEMIYRGRDMSVAEFNALGRASSTGIQLSPG